jgi:hypothetical protein
VTLQGRQKYRTISLEVLNMLSEAQKLADVIERVLWWQKRYCFPVVDEFNEVVLAGVNEFLQQICAAQG